MPGETRKVNGAFHLEDCAITEIQSSGYCPKYASGVLLYPQASTRAVLTIPEQHRNWRSRIRIRSTYARAQIDISIDERVRRLLRFLRVHIRRFPPSLRVTVSNYGTLPLFLEQGSRIAYITNAPHLRPIRPCDVEITPHKVLHENGFAVKLFASARRLRIDEQYILRTPRGVPYIRLPAEGRNCFVAHDTIPGEITIAPNKTGVFYAREHIAMPPDCYGRIVSVLPDCPHSTAVIINPGSNGPHALELRAQRTTVIWPGMHVANLYVFKPTNPQRPYNGRYLAK